MAAAATRYFSLERFFLGRLASERFFRHLPDFVLSRSFDHLPSFTVGTGTGFHLEFSFRFISIYNYAIENPYYYSPIRKSTLSCKCVTLNWSSTPIESQLGLSNFGD